MTSRPSFPDADAPIFAAGRRLPLADRAAGGRGRRSRISGSRSATTVSTLDDRFELLADRLALDPLERVVLALTAMSDISPELGSVLAAGDPVGGSVRTTPRIVARLLAHAGYAEGGVYRALDAHRHAAAHRRPAPARRRPTTSRSSTARSPARGAVATFLLAADVDDPSRGGRLRRIDPPALPLGREAVVARLRSLLALADGPVPFLHGPDADLLLAPGRRRRRAGGRARSSSADPVLRLDAAIAAILEQRVLAIDGLTALEPREAGQLAGWLVNLPRPVLLGHGPRDIAALDGLSITEVARPAAVARGAQRRMARRPRRRRRARARSRRCIACRSAASTTRSATSLATIGDRAAARRPRPTPPTPRGAPRRRALGETAQRIDGDLRLGRPRAAAAAARRAALARRVHAPPRPRARRVGLRRAARAAAHGMVALFTGESGTGKTMAALVVARELGLELYRVDLSTMVSKWIGETERNLDRVFNAAAGSSAMLFFDEADAMFGKRSAIGDARDRYANIGVSYLLQRLEQHDGAVILATNLLGNIDTAFLRRFTAVIEFPFPNAAQRRLLWDRLIPAQGAGRRRPRPRLPRRALRAVGRRDPQRRARGGGDRRRRSRPDRHGAPRARGGAGVREARPPHGRGRLRPVPRARAQPADVRSYAFWCGAAKRRCRRPRAGVR